MKILKSLLFALLLILIPTTGVFASNIVIEKDGESCLDLDAAYEEVYNTSKAVTGKEQSLDAIKKAETLATLTNIMSLFVGDRIFCVNDEIAASKVNSFKGDGLLGMMEHTSFTLMGGLPDIRVADHLAKSFIPGYGGNVGSYALSDTYEGCLEDCATRDDKLACEGACRTLRDLGSFSESDQSSSSTTPTSTYTPSSSSFSSSSTTPTSTISSDGDSGSEDGRRGRVERKLTSDIDDTFSTLDNDLMQELDEDLSELEDPSDKTVLSGYDYLKDNLKLDSMWAEFRNIAYLFFVVIFIAIGFMIMFRKKLPGQMVVSLGNSIPNVILALILVTFSFAISGIMLDIGRATMNITGNFFERAYKDTEQEVIEIENVGTMMDGAVEAAKPPGWLASFFGGPTGAAAIQIYAPKLIERLDVKLNKVIGHDTKITTKVAEIVAKLRGTADSIEDSEMDGGAAAGFNLDGLITLIKMGVNISLSGLKYSLLMGLARNLLLLAVCAYASFRLFLTIISTYFKIFLAVVMAPLQLMTGALPGNSVAFVNWFKNMAANILVFPVIFFLINFFSYLANQVDPEEFNYFGNKGIIWPDWIITLKGVIVIAGYLFAASTPNLIKGFFKVGEDKSLAMAGQSVQKAAAKIPLIGGMFNG